MLVLLTCYIIILAILSLFWLKYSIKYILMNTIYNGFDSDSFCFTYHVKMLTYEPKKTQKLKRLMINFTCYILVWTFFIRWLISYLFSLSCQYLTSEPAAGQHCVFSLCVMVDVCVCVCWWSRCVCFTLCHTPALCLRWRCSVTSDGSEPKEPWKQEKRQKSSSSSLTNQSQGRAE